MLLRSERGGGRVADGSGAPDKGLLIASSQVTASDHYLAETGEAAR
jgi:hypothetical protein